MGLVSWERRPDLLLKDLVALVDQVGCGYLEDEKHLQVIKRSDVETTKLKENLSYSLNFSRDPKR